MSSSKERRLMKLVALDRGLTWNQSSVRAASGMCQSCGFSIPTEVMCTQAQLSFGVLPCASRATAGPEPQGQVTLGDWSRVHPLWGGSSALPPEHCYRTNSPQTRCGFCHGNSKPGSICPSCRKPVANMERWKEVSVNCKAQSK